MLTKTATAPAKAIVDEGDLGEFEALVAVFGNVDAYGDRIVKGAFADSLAEWSQAGDPIPVIWSHMMGDPDMHLGVVVEATETDAGLLVKGQLDLDNPKAAQVWRLLKGRRVTQFSFAYDILDGGPVTEDGESVYELRRLKLYEVGPTLIGVNQETELLGVKHAVEGALVKAGRTLSAQNEDRLRQASSLLGEVLSTVGTDDGSKATHTDSPPNPGGRTPQASLAALAASELELELNA